MTEDRILSYPDALCNQIKRLAVEAGEAALLHFDESGAQALYSKEDGSPVTQADKDAEEIIRKGLLESTPSVPMIGEESVANGNIPVFESQGYFWLVDPIDGTREFVAGSGDFTVNIALIKNNEPVLGVIYAPYYGELYAGFGAGTATRWLEETDNEKEIRVRRPPREGLTVMSSKSMKDLSRQDAFLENFKVNKVLKRGSSLKLCHVAAGKADLYVRFGETSEWDTAAGEAILRSAGGALVDTQGKPLIYGRHTNKFHNPEFIAYSAQFDLFGSD